MDAAIVVLPQITTCFKRKKAASQTAFMVYSLILKILISTFLP